MTTAPPTPRRRGWLALLPFVGLVAALALVVWLIDVEAAGAALVSADLRWLAAALALALVASALVAGKLFVLLRAVDEPRPLARCWSAVMAAVTLNAVLPGRGGDLVRAVFLVEGAGSLPVLLGAVLFERLVDVTALGLLVAGLSALRGVDGWTVVGLGVAAAGLAVVAVLSLGGRLPFKPELGERLGRASSRLLRRPAVAALLLGLSVLTWGNNLALLVCALFAAGVDLPLLDVLRAGPVAILAGILPVSVSGIGTRDAALLLLLGGAGLPEATAGAVAAGGLLYTVANYWFLALVGGAALGPETLRTVSKRRDAAHRVGDSPPPAS